MEKGKVMVNTTDLMVTSFFDEDAIEWINNKTGLDFKQLTDGCNAGGAKMLSFESFGTCPCSIGTENIKQVIKAFKEAPFESPEYAVLLIDCDNQDELNGVITLR